MCFHPNAGPKCWPHTRAAHISLHLCVRAHTSLIFSVAFDRRPLPSPPPIYVIHPSFTHPYIPGLTAPDSINSTHLFGQHQPSLLIFSHNFLSSISQVTILLIIFMISLNISPPPIVFSLFSIMSFIFYFCLQLSEMPCPYLPSFPPLSPGTCGIRVGAQTRDSPGISSQYRTPTACCTHIVGM